MNTASRVILRCALLASVAVASATASESRILFIPKQENLAFWQSAKAGAERAAKELSTPDRTFTIVFKGPTSASDVKGQTALVDGASAPTTSAIILSAVDRKELVDPVLRAVGRGVPVECIVAGVDTDKTVGFAGDLNFMAGQVGARSLGKAMGGKGEAILFRHHIGAGDTEQREQGFLEVMGEEFPGIHLDVTDFHAGPSPSIAERVTASLLKRFSGRLGGVFASSELAGRAVARQLAASDDHLVKLVTVEDEGPDIRSFLKAGVLTGLVEIDPEAAGYEAARAVIASLEGTSRTGGARPVVSLETAAGREDGVGDEVSTSPESVLARGRGILVVPTGGIVMVGIPAGAFDMGSKSADRQFRDGDSPQRHVTISKDFWLGKFELTQAQWVAVMGENPSDFRGADYPVDNVTWNDAVRFCEKLSDLERKAGRLPAGFQYRLPTEAEWEYACRAGNDGARDGQLDDLGWYVGNSGSWNPPPGPVSRGGGVWQMTTHPVGQKRPNAWGLYDMYGNVLEWCEDFYGPYTSGLVTDPKGPAAGDARVLRGGGFWTDAEVCFAFSRSKAPPARHHNSLGLRVALTPVP